MAMSGDTGPTDKLWKVLNKVPRTSRRCCWRRSFPNQLQELADISGHLTPQTLETELDKFDRRGARCCCTT